MPPHLLLDWIMILTLAVGPQFGERQAGIAFVGTDPVRLEIGAGQSETLHILLGDADKIYGIDLQVGFDPAVVEVVDADSKKSGVQMLPGGFLKADFVVLNLADNKKGALHYVATQLNPTSPASGTGIVLSVRFRGKKAGTHSKIAFTSVVIADRRGIKRPVSTRDGELIIIKPKPSTPTPRIPPTLTLPAPALPTSVFTQVRIQPTPRPSLIATLTGVPVQPRATVIQYGLPVQTGGISIQEGSIRSPEADAAFSDRILAYITMGGFSGAVLLFALTVLLLAVKRRRNLPTNGVQGTGRVGDDTVSNPGMDQKEGSAKSN